MKIKCAHTDKQVRYLQRILVKSSARLRNGHFEPKPVSHYIQRFHKSYRKTEIGCWEWIGRKSNYGYGHFNLQRRTRWAHRIAYQLEFGDLRPGLVIRHSCDNPSCVNPAHLSAGSQRDNIHDQIDRGRHRYSNKNSSCKSGHPLDGDNLYLTSKGHRQCRACKKDAKARFEERQK